MFFEYPNIDPVAFYIGPLAVRWYSLAYLAGFIMGWRYCLYLAGLDKNKHVSREDIDDFLPWAIAGVILGGRLGYVMFYNFSLYASYPLDIFKVWQGGMSFHGGMLGVLFTLIAYPMIKKIPKLRIADIVCAAAPIGLFFGRIANFINGELYGRATNVAWGIKFPAGGDVLRHPSQLYEAALEGALLFAVLSLLIRNDKIRNRPGIVAGVFLIGYGAFRSFIEFFREPDAQIGFVTGSFSMGQLLSIPMMAIGVAFVIYALRKKHEKPA